jgi:hypothetical protein
VASGHLTNASGNYISKVAKSNRISHRGLPTGRQAASHKCSKPI